MTEPTMTLEGRDALIVHIEGLQATLTKRNARIAELEAIVNGDKDNPKAAKAIRDAYRDGWQSCAYKIANETQGLVSALQSARKVALGAAWNPEEEA